MKLTLVCLFILVWFLPAVCRRVGHRWCWNIIKQHRYWKGFIGYKLSLYLHVTKAACQRQGFMRLFPTRRAVCVMLTRTVLPLPSQAGRLVPLHESISEIRKPVESLCCVQLFCRLAMSLWTMKCINVKRFWPVVNIYSSTVQFGCTPLPLFNNFIWLRCRFI